MNDPAAFRATFSDWKLIRTRKVVQLVFELPVEQADLAYKVLGGMPNPAESVWCAVARLTKESEVMPDSVARRTNAKATPERDVAPPVQPQDKVGRAKRSWNELSAAEQAGIRCSERAFLAFLKEYLPAVWIVTAGTPEKERAVAMLYAASGIRSRAEINVKNPDIYNWWQMLDSDYCAWLREPEYVP